MKFTRCCRARFDAKTSDDDLKGNPVVPGGSATSKPMWSNTSVYSSASAFFVASM